MVHCNVKMTIMTIKHVIRVYFLISTNRRVGVFFISYSVIENNPNDENVKTSKNTRSIIFEDNNKILNIF